MAHYLAEASTFLDLGSAAGAHRSQGFLCVAHTGKTMEITQPGYD